MTDWVFTPGVVEVAEAEYRRLLGYPPGAAMSERACELAAWAREWYARHGKPWIYAREAAALNLGGGAVEIEGVAFHAGRLRTALQQAEAHTVVLAAASAGPEAEEESRRLWLDAGGEAEIARVQCLPGYLMADDLARAALFLAADDSRMCTGQDFIVDGGWV